MSTNDPHPAALAHIGGCESCRHLLGLAIHHLRIGQQVSSCEIAGEPRVVVQAAGDVYWVLVGSRLDLATRDPDLASDHASEVFKSQQKRREANPMTPPELNGQLEEVLQIAGAWFPDLEIPELQDWRERSK